VEEQRKKCCARRMSMRKPYINFGDFHRNNTIKHEPPFVKGIVTLETKEIRLRKSAVTAKKNLLSVAENAVVSALSWKKTWIIVVCENAAGEPSRFCLVGERFPSFQ
jgi:hypothetical protein